MNLIRNKILRIVWLLGILLPLSLLAKPTLVQKNEYFKFKHININDGLSNNQVKTILKDSNGFMWFGTGQGLNRFDGTSFKTFVHSVNDSTSIPFNEIDYLFEDSDGRLWIHSLQQFVIYNPELEIFQQPGSTYKNTSVPINGLRALFCDSQGNTWLVNSNFGLYKYSPENGAVDSIAFFPQIETPIYNNYLNCVVEAPDKKLWAVSNAGEVIRINPETKELEQHYLIGEEVIEEYNNFQLFVDSDNDVWIYSPGLAYGVYRIENKTGNLLHYKQNGAGNTINNNMVSSVVEDESGLIWIATDHGGINILEKKQGKFTILNNQRDKPYSIAQNSITYLYRDNENIIWAGTFKQGISYYHKNLIRFNHYNYSADIANSLPFNDVNCFVEDAKRNLWIGTNGEGLIYFNRKKNTFSSFKHNPQNPNSLSANVVVSLFIDREGILWIGTYTGGLNRFDGKTFKHFKNEPDNPNSLSDNRVWEILEDSKQNLWIGTLNGGLNLLDRDKEQFVHYYAEDINSVGSNFITSIIEDSEQNLWMGTSNGLDVLNLNTKRFRHYSPNPKKAGQLSHKNALDIHEDSRGLIWVATTQGLNVLNKNEGVFKVFTETDGLSNSSIKTILEDEQSNIWISTLKGISKIQVLDYTTNNSIAELRIKVENFGLLDGLQGNEFNQKSAYRTRSGELIFGGANGFNLFLPENISDYQPNSKIILTNLQIFDNDVKVNALFEKRVILEKSISWQDHITLLHNENVFSFQFAALNYFHPEKNQFQYRLVGFNNKWLNVNAEVNEVTFTNLDAGTYQFQIRGTNDKHTWTEMESPLTIEVLPPFWKSNIAYFIYLVIFILLIFGAWKILNERQRLKFKAEQEHCEAERMQQVDALKTKFFTNVSHEFRTPLSLIISPLEKLIDKTKNEEHLNHLILIHRNSRRLLAMVNQLLDFRKMELQKIEVKESWGDIIGYIREIGMSFEDLVKSKNIEYQFSTNCKTFATFFDKDKTDKIVTNLLSNAFKFTPENGKVKLDICLNKANNSSVQIVVKDTGIGIHPEQQERIFDRFYQTNMPLAELNQGTGIGLSMVKEYITLLGGTIKVDSIVNQGSTFTTEFPVQLFSEKEIQENERNWNKQEKKIAAPNKVISKPSEHNKLKKTIIIVEDNIDLRFYLKDNLKDLYNVLEAENGTDGWELIETKKPDIVVSDVMMPGLNGIELCKRIKKHRNTKHIPIILLTAKAETSPVIEGFKSGADAYIAKPFDFQILVSRIENLISSREQLRLSFQSMIGINPEKIEVNSEDEKFIKKALQIVEKNIPEATFSVEDFSMEMGMNRVSLYKKLLALTDKNPTEFIRIIRLKRATHLLEMSQLTVAEVAYEVGFNNPRYFSKYFSKQYKMTPSEYIVKYRKQKIEISQDLKNKFSIHR